MQVDSAVREVNRVPVDVPVTLKCKRIAGLGPLTITLKQNFQASLVFEFSILPGGIFRFTHISRSRSDEAPRKTFVALLELMTPPKPKTQDATGKSAGGIELMGKAAMQEDPHMAMISSYRRKLSMMLN